MKHHFMIAAVTACFAVTPAFAQNQPASPEPGTTPRPQQQPLERDKGTADKDAGAGTARTASGDRAAAAPVAKSMTEHFVRGAWSGNQLEVQLGKLAQERGESNDVKEMGKMLAQHHQEAQQQLQQAAKSAGMELPTEMTPVHQAMLAEMQKLEGRMFDKAFLAGQTGDHLKNVLKYRDASKEIEQPQIKQYAQQTLPVLRQHFQKLQQLAGADGEAMPASGTLKATPPTEGVNSNQGTVPTPRP